MVGKNGAAGFENCNFLPALFWKPVIRMQSGKKVGEGRNFLNYKNILSHDIRCNITQQLIKSNWCTEHYQWEQKYKYSNIIDYLQAVLAVSFHKNFESKLKLLKY